MPSSSANGCAALISLLFFLLGREALSGKNPGFAERMMLSLDDGIYIIYILYMYIVVC